MKIGTLMRCAEATEERIAFLRDAGLDGLQIAGVYEDWLAPTPEAREASDALFALFANHGMAVPSLFLSYPGQDWDNPEETVGLFPAGTRGERLVATCRQMANGWSPPAARWRGPPATASGSSPAMRASSPGNGTRSTRVSWPT